MKVKRIVPSIGAADVAKATVFYGDVLGLELLMDLDWIRTYGNAETMKVQLSVASQGGSGTPVPDPSIEVDVIAMALARFDGAGFPIECGRARAKGHARHPT